MELDGFSLSGSGLAQPARPAHTQPRSVSRVSAAAGVKPEWQVQPDRPTTVANNCQGEVYAVNPFPGDLVVATTEGGVADAVVHNPDSEPKLVPLPANWSLHSVTSMAVQSHAWKDRAVLALKCKLAHRLATETMQGGDVCLFVPHGHKVTAKKCDQGKAHLNTLEAFKSREGLRGHTAIVDVLDEWWQHLTDCHVKGACHGYMTKAQYMESGIIVMKSLCPDEPHADIVDAVEEDWVNDSQGQDRMNFTQFFDCMFELADMWCDSIDGNDYADFLRGIFENIHQGTHTGCTRVGSSGMWHAARSVMSMPKTLYEAGGYDINNFADREKAAKGAVRDIMRLVDKFSNNGKITVTEMNAHLLNTSFGGFCEWLTRYSRRNWMRFDKDKDGRINEHELYDAMMAFLVSDGYGREFDRVTDPGVGFKRLEAVPSPRRGNSTSASGPAEVQPSQPMSPSVDVLEGDLPESWLHMKNICKTIGAVDSIYLSGDQQSNKLKPHFMRCSNVLSDDEKEEARKMFDSYDKNTGNGNGTIEKHELFVAFGLLNLKDNPEKLRRRVEIEFQNADTNNDNVLDFNEFLGLYNKLQADNLTSSIEDFI